MLYSPYANATIVSIDTSAAEKLPGVKAVLVIAGAGKKVQYQGDDIAAVAAETEEQARDAVRAIKVEYEILPHVVTEAQAMAPGAPEIVKGGNTRKARAITKGKPEEAMKTADVTIEATYSLPVITHVCLETHGLTAKWEGEDKLVAWASTQSVRAVAGELAEQVQRPDVERHRPDRGDGRRLRLEVRGRHLGPDRGRTLEEGGRTSGPDVPRPDPGTPGGRQSSERLRPRGAGCDQGRQDRLPDRRNARDRRDSRADRSSRSRISTTSPTAPRAHTDVFVNAGKARAMRAPGHPQGCSIMEAAMDDLADKMGIDPLEFRLKNLPADQKPDLKPVYEAEVKMGADLIGWSNRKPRGTNGKGPIKRGLGMALHTWGGRGVAGKQVSCTISPDGSVEVKSATQDIGTGARTVLAIIAAEVLGLEVTDIHSNIGNSTFPPGQGSGGSTTTPSMSPPTYQPPSQGPRRALRQGRPRARTPSPKTSRWPAASCWSRARSRCPGRTPAASSA